MSRYLTVEEVAERLNVSASWVYKHKHLLGAVRLGERLWRFPEQELAARLAAMSAYTFTCRLAYGLTCRSWRRVSVPVRPS